MQLHEKNGLNFKFSSDSTAGSLSFGSAGRNPDVQYERGQKIVPDNIAPNESEIPVRQYNLCVMRSRIKGARAEGRLQLTNKRILFRAKGTAPVGETTIQHEFSIDEVAGFQIVRNFRFSILDLLLIFALSVAIGYIGVGFGGFLGRTLKAFGQLLVYVLALAVAVPAFVWMPREQYAGKCVFLSASVGLFTVLREMIYFKSSFLTVLSQIFIYVPYLILVSCWPPVSLRLRSNRTWSFLSAPKQARPLFPSAAKRLVLLRLAMSSMRSIWDITRFCLLTRQKKQSAKLVPSSMISKNLVIMALPNGKRSDFCLSV